MKIACHVIMWEFSVIPEKIEQFEEYYGQTGVWVQFFRQGSGYLNTQLLKNQSMEGHYITVDRWASEQDYHIFRTQYAEQYAAIDQQCEHLIEHEVFIGDFSEN